MKLFLGVLALWCGACAARTSAATGMLVSAEWLAENLQQHGLVVLHVGTQKDYDAGHIPGARLAALADLSVTGERGLRLELPPVQALAGALGRLGIAKDSRIVIYPAAESVQSATRVWYTLEWAGLGDRAALLDGGLAAWRAAGKPVDTASPPGGTTTPSLTPHPELVVNAEWVRAHGAASDVALLDARLPEFYSGADAGNMPRAGRIPGARNLPFSSLLDSQRKLKPAAELRELFAQRGATPGKTVVVYCHIGQQATLLYFAARLIGLEPRLYDGSFQDWSSRPDLPVETGTR